MSGTSAQVAVILAAALAAPACCGPPIRSAESEAMLPGLVRRQQPLVEAMVEIDKTGALRVDEAVADLSRSPLLAHARALVCRTPGCEEAEDLEWSYLPQERTPSTAPARATEQVERQLQAIADGLLASPLARAAVERFGADPCELPRLKVQVEANSSPRRIYCEPPARIVISQGALEAVLLAVGQWVAQKGWVDSDALGDGPAELLMVWAELRARAPDLRITVDEVPAEVRALLARGCLRDARCVESRLDGAEGPAGAWFERLEEGVEFLSETLGERGVGLLMAEAEYLKALTFLVAHEAAHVWFDGCGAPSRPQEERADAFATLASFTLFGQHVGLSRAQLEASDAPSAPTPEPAGPLLEWLVPDDRLSTDDDEGPSSERSERISGLPASGNDAVGEFPRTLLDPYSGEVLSWDGLGVYARVLVATGYEADRAAYPSLRERVAANRAQVRQLLVALLGREWTGKWAGETRWLDAP